MRDITIQDMVTLLNEIGEQAVVAMVERGDGEEHDPIMDMLARKVQIINAITERVNEMTAVEYLEAKTEMCDSDWNAASCNRCELRGSCEERGCAYFEQEHPFLSVEIVKRWKEKA